MKCSICHKEVVLVPSASERAKKYGDTANYYTQLFPTHAECALQQRARETSELMKIIREGKHGIS